MKDVCQDHELERHAGFSSQLKSEVHGLEGQFACFVDKTAKLEEELQNFTQMTILKCSEVMNRKRNLAFINIPEDWSPTTYIQRQTLTKSLSTSCISSTSRIPSHTKKSFRRMGVTRDSRPQLVVTEVSTLEVREITQSKLGFLAHSVLRSIGIIPNTLSYRNLQVLPPEHLVAYRVSLSLISICIAPGVPPYLKPVSSL